MTTTRQPSTGQEARSATTAADYTADEAVELRALCERVAAEVRYRLGPGSDLDRPEETLTFLAAIRTVLADATRSAEAINRRAERRAATRTRPRACPPQG
jgi:hypothetical protein